jgi:hypothetical protein
MSGIRPRDVVLSFAPHEEGKPYVVRLRHKPSNLTAEGTGPTYDEAKAQAEAELQTQVEVAGAVSC